MYLLSFPHQPFRRPILQRARSSVFLKLKYLRGDTIKHPPQWKDLCSTRNKDTSREKPSERKYDKIVVVDLIDGI